MNMKQETITSIHPTEVIRVCVLPQNGRAEIEFKSSNDECFVLIMYFSGEWKCAILEPLSTHGYIVIACPAILAGGEAMMSYAGNQEGFIDPNDNQKVWTTAEVLMKQVQSLVDSRNYYRDWKSFANYQREHRNQKNKPKNTI